MSPRTSFALLAAAVTASCAHRPPPATSRAPAPTAPAAPPAPPATARPTADDAWAHRAEPGRLEQAIAGWERLAAASPARADLELALARAYTLVGERARDSGGSAEAQAEAYAQAVRAGEAALAAASPAVAARLDAGTYVEDALEGAGVEVLPAVYVYATSVAGFALARGLAGAVHLQRRVEVLFDWVIVHDEGHACAGAHRG